MLADSKDSPKTFTMGPIPPPCCGPSPDSPPVHGLHAKPLLNAGAQSLLVVQAAEADEHSVLMGLIFLPAGIDLRDQGIKVGVWS